MAEPDTELFDQAIEGDIGALRTLLTRYGPEAAPRGRRYRSAVRRPLGAAPGT